MYVQKMGKAGYLLGTGMETLKRKTNLGFLTEDMLR